MYRRPKFLEVLLEIRREMALEVDYDLDRFVAGARKGTAPANGTAIAEFQNEAGPLDIATEVLTFDRRRSAEIRKG